MQRTKTSDYKDVSLTISQRVESLLAQMTLDEKIGQMTQVEKNSITPAEVRDYFIGSVLSGGGGNPTPNTPQTWAQMVHAFQEPALTTRLGIPLIYGSDAVHGHNNVKGAVIFPHNVGLGATHDAALVERIGRVVAAECAATGVRWNFAPAVSVPQDIRWGRTYEGFSEDTELVTQLGTAFVRGLQDTKDGHLRGVLASVKHFLADGGTQWGEKPAYPWILTWRPPANDQDALGLDQGNTIIDEATLRAVHLPPYQAAIAEGALNIMISYSSWQGLKMHAHRYLMTDVLKNELQFEGFLVSDWFAIDQVHPDFHTAVAMVINAGLDMVMVPFDFKRFISALRDVVTAGDVPMTRIDDAVRRILLAKFRLGLFEQPFADEALLEQVGSPAHRAVAQEAVRKSLVLLKNKQDILPLPKTPGRLLVAGEAADDIGLQCGGWTIEWMGQSGNITPGTTLLEGIRQTISPETSVIYNAAANFAPDVKADVGILVIAEGVYAEGQGDRSDLTLPPQYTELTDRMRQHCAQVVTILLSGRPLILTEHLNKWDALVAAWLPGTEGQGVADVVFGDYPFSGNLSYSWPHGMDQIPLAARRQSGSAPLWPLGFGLHPNK